jgi:hypothetical protein
MEVDVWAVVELFIGLSRILVRLILDEALQAENVEDPGFTKVDISSDGFVLSTRSSSFAVLLSRDLQCAVDDDDVDAEGGDGDFCISLEVRGINGFFGFDLICSNLGLHVETL